MEENLPLCCNKPGQEENKTAPEATSHLFSNVDLISSLPDEILHHILSFVPTDLAITTSTLSKRWRHVWCGVPCLSLSPCRDSVEYISETLAMHTATKLKRFHLNVDSPAWAPAKRNLDSLVKFAISRNVEKLSLVLDAYCYSFSDFFFNNPSLKQLTVDSKLVEIIPNCTVSWTSLQNLSLSGCIFSDESFPRILSGCPMLESLTLQYIGFLSCLDLSEWLHLRRLDIEFNLSVPRKLHIVAPRIRYLRLIDLKSDCTLSNVPSLTEANIDTSDYLPRLWCLQIDLSKDLYDPSKDEYHVMLQAMLEKLQNVENLTVGLSFLQMLSIAEFCGLPFPTFKVKTLTLKTTILRSAVLGIAKLLQNSPGLNKLIFHKTEDWDSAVEERVNRYLGTQDMIFPASSAFKVAKPDVVASFVELFLGNATTLETLVVQLGSCLDGSNSDELSQIALKLSDKFKVSVVLK